MLRRALSVMRIVYDGCAGGDGVPTRWFRTAAAPAATISEARGAWRALERGIAPPPQRGQRLLQRKSQRRSPSSLRRPISTSHLRSRPSPHSIRPQPLGLRPVLRSPRRRGGTARSAFRVRIAQRSASMFSKSPRRARRQDGPCSLSPPGSSGTARRPSSTPRRGSIARGAKHRRPCGHVDRIRLCCSSIARSKKCRTSVPRGAPECRSRSARIASRCRAGRCAGRWPPRAATGSCFERRTTSGPRAEIAVRPWPLGVTSPR